MAMVCAYVPGASRLSRRSSGRLRSDHSTSVSGVVIPVSRSASGSRNIASTTETNAFNTPKPALAPIWRVVQPSVRPSVTAAKKYATPMVMT